jgi:hypothetical protein
MDEDMTDERKHPEGELTRLADGTLTAERRADLLTQIQKSPDLTADLAEQKRAVTMLRALDEPAPAALRARLDEMTGASAPRRSRRWRRMFVLPGATALAAAAAVVVVLVSGGSSAPTVPGAARLALAASTMPAPPVDHSDPTDLTLKAAGIPFPAWGVKAGWVTSGARSDTAGGRKVTTVFYVDADGERIGYAITDGAPLSGAHGSTVKRYGVNFTLQTSNGARIISWVRQGHTCVIAGRTVSYERLVALATADEQDAQVGD